MDVNKRNEKVWRQKHLIGRDVGMGLSACSGEGSRVTSTSQQCWFGNSFCLCSIEEDKTGRKIALKGSREGDELCLIPAQPGSDPWHRGCCRKLPFPPLPLHSSLSCPGDTKGCEDPRVPPVQLLAGSRCDPKLSQGLQSCRMPQPTCLGLCWGVWVPSLGADLCARSLPAHITTADPGDVG